MNGANGLLAKPARAPLVVGLVVVTGLGLGYGSDATALSVLAGGSGLSFVGGCWFLARESIRARLLGSVVTSAALLGIVASLTLGATGAALSTASSLLAFGTVVTVVLAVTAAGCALVPADPFRSALSSCVREAALAAGVVTPFVALALSGRLVEGIWIGFRVLPVRASSTPSTALATLQVLTLVGFGVLATTRTTRALLARRGYSIPPIGTLYERVREWHELVYLVPVGYGLLWVEPRTRRAIDSAFYAMEPVGHVVADALTSGWPVTIVLVGIGCVGVVSTAATLEPTCRAWLEPVPLRTLAGASGGAIVSVVVLLGASVTDDGGTAPLAVVLTGGAWIAVVGLWLVTPRLSARLLGEREWRVRLVGLGATALFAGTVIGSIAGVHPLGIVAGVAATLLVWDLGTHGLSLRNAAGADTGLEPAASHAVVTVLVVGFGCALSAGALWVSWWVDPTVESPLAVAAISLSVLAVVVLAGGSLLAGSVRDSLSGASRLARRTSAITRLQAIAISIPIWFGLAAAVDRRFMIVAISCIAAVAFRSPGRWRRFDDWVDQY